MYDEVVGVKVVVKQWCRGVAVYKRRPFNPDETGGAALNRLK